MPPSIPTPSAASCVLVNARISPETTTSTLLLYRRCRERRQPISTIAESQDSTTIQVDAHTNVAPSNDAHRLRSNVLARHPHLYLPWMQRQDMRNQRERQQRRPAMHASMAEPSTSSEAHPMPEMPSGRPDAKKGGDSRPSSSAIHQIWHPSSRTTSATQPSTSAESGGLHARLGASNEPERVALVFPGLVSLLYASRCVHVDH